MGVLEWLVMLVLSDLMALMVPVFLVLWALMALWGR